MELTLIRHNRCCGYTEGKLLINGLFFCDTLEDADLGLDSSMSLSDILHRKEPAHTAIPYGKYEVTLSESPRFGRVLPLLLNVKGYSGVRIHAGNTADDTQGCILVGRKDRDGHITKSREMENRLLAVLRKAGDTITIEITMSKL